MAELVKNNWADTLPQNVLDALNMERPHSRLGENVMFSLGSTDSNGRTLSPQQREYFRDPKVLDENGNLMVMYHGTNGGKGVTGANY